MYILLDLPVPHSENTAEYAIKEQLRKDSQTNVPCGNTMYDRGQLDTSAIDEVSMGEMADQSKYRVPEYSKFLCS